MKSQIFSKYWFDFVFVMTVKEIKARYKRVFFGFLWALLNPVLQMLVIGFIFKFFVATDIDNYFYFLFAGLLPWNFFSMTVSKCTPIMLNERALIQKSNFPREALVLSIVFSDLFHFFVSLLIFFLIISFLGVLTLGKLFLLIFVILWLVVFITGISLLFSTLFVRFRDMKFFVQALIPLWFYATPIMYTRELLPINIANLLNYNPMTGIVELFQFIFSNNAVHVNLHSLVPGFLISFIIIFTGIYFFMKENQYFDDWL